MQFKKIIKYLTVFSNLLVYYGPCLYCRLTW